MPESVRFLIFMCAILVGTTTVYQLAALAGGGGEGARSTDAASPDEAFPGRQPAPEKTEVEVTEVPGLIATIISAAKDKNWTLMVSAILMLLVFFTKTILLRFLPDAAKKAALPWISVGGATIVVTAATLASGGPWWEAINGGFITGTAASGLWSLVGKHILKLFDKKNGNGDRIPVPIK